ncbi:MAG TPA: CRTAC1 family protein, partial [Candidatus Binatia bacterium]|nr:CRTAC1 family protein [Candidatus Binatia bacterium]
AGVSGIPTQWSTACSWVDYDNDGDLDLYVGRYVKWSREIDFEVGYKLVGIGRAYGPPMNFEGAFASFYRNDGNGRFTDVSKEAGVEIRNPATGVPSAKTLGVAPIDLDNDGWIDLVVANDTVQNFVFHNEKNGTFKEVGALSGIAFDSYGNTRGAMGIDAARYRNGKTVGVAIGNFANEMTALYVAQNDAGLIYTDETISEGIGPASRLPLKFGVFFFDYDLDGRLDLLSVNGHLEEEISKIQQSQRYAQSAQLFWNTGAANGPGFAMVPEARAGGAILKPIVGRGSAFGDFDNDGDLDVVFTQTGGAPLVLRNDQALNHHWLRLRLIGKKANRDAIGAWIHVKVGDQLLARQVMPTRSYLSQSELPVTIGLGASGKVDDVEIVWPGGKVQKIANARIDSLTVVEQAE